MEFIALWIFFAILAGVIADRKGRNPIVWGFMGIIFGIFAVIIIAVMGEAKTDH
jgi:biotin transporter BioY